MQKRRKPLNQLSSFPRLRLRGNSFKQPSSREHVISVSHLGRSLLIWLYCHICSIAPVSLPPASLIQDTPVSVHLTNLRIAFVNTCAKPRPGGPIRKPIGQPALRFRPTPLYVAVHRSGKGTAYQILCAAMSSMKTPAPTRTSNGFHQDQRIKHPQYIPVVAALAETFVPALPDKAADAEKQGLHDLAQLQAFGGSSQSAQVDKVHIVASLAHLQKLIAHTQATLFLIRRSSTALRLG